MFSYGGKVLRLLYSYTFHICKMKVWKVGPWYLQGVHSRTSHGYQFLRITKPTEGSPRYDQEHLLIVSGRHLQFSLKTRTPRGCDWKMLPVVSGRSLRPSRYGLSTGFVSRSTGAEPVNKEDQLELHLFMHYHCRIREGEYLASRIFLSVQL